jgi:hypothetical protein
LERVFERSLVEPETRVADDHRFGTEFFPCLERGRCSHSNFVLALLRMVCLRPWATMVLRFSASLAALRFFCASLLCFLLVLWVLLFFLGARESQVHLTKAFLLRSLRVYSGLIMPGLCLLSSLLITCRSARYPAKKQRAPQNPHGPASRRPRPSAEPAPLPQPLYCLSTRPTSPPYPAPQLLSPPSPPPSPDPLACDLQLAPAAVSAARRDSAPLFPPR